MSERLTITRPDDCHLHVRDGDAIATTVRHTAERFARAIIMPNLKPPVCTVDTAAAYRERIRAAVPDEIRFEPLMTLYLTDDTSPEEIARAIAAGFIHGIKLYPAGATTHSDAGVTDLKRCRKTLAAMQANDLPLLVHAETANPAVDVFDREKIFLEEQLAPVIREFPELRIVVEHITTQHAVDFVLAGSERLAATITAHHLLLNRNAMLSGGIRPHHYCLPILKRDEHRRAVIEAAISGNPKFFLGTDSAPHPRQDKESACGCAGIYTAHAALELYAQVFDEAGALDKLEGFASFFGADFYGLPRNTGSVTLVRKSWEVPSSYPLGDEEVVPLRADELVPWSILETQMQ